MDGPPYGAAIRFRGDDPTFAKGALDGTARPLTWRPGVAWIALFFAGLLEIGWALGLKASAGFTRPLPTVLTIIAMLASFGFLGLALRTLPLGTAYAVWTGIGTVGTVLIGMAFYGEPADYLRLGCITLIVSGIVGLKLLSPQ